MSKKLVRANASDLQIDTEVWRVDKRFRPVRGIVDILSYPSIDAPLPTRAGVTWFTDDGRPYSHSQVTISRVVRRNGRWEVR